MPELLDSTLQFLRHHGLSAEADVMQRQYHLVEPEAVFDSVLAGETFADMALAEMKEARAERNDAVGEPF